MTRLSRLPLAVTAAFLLTYAAVSNATDVAQRPLAGSSLISPNLIFGIDDSGSMDYEIMLSTYNGFIWWDVPNKRGWASDGTPNIGAGLPTADLRSYAYLFPLGAHSSGNFDAKSVYGPDGQTIYTYDWGNAVPPTAQYAAARSAAYNPIYYDPAKTYTPWKPRYDSTASGDMLKTYSNASTTAARAHPEATGSGAATMDLTTDRARDTSNSAYFTMYGGGIVPSGSRWREVTGTDMQNVGFSGTTTSDIVVPDGKTYHVAMAYFPATYWVKETCTVPASVSPGDTCARGPDGATIKRYEIKSSTTSYPSGRNYTDELQNFANWFTYYRKRQNMLAASMGEVMDGLSGLIAGAVKFNNRVDVTMYDTNDTDNSKNGRRILESIYTQQLEIAGTPTRETLKHIGEQYRTRTSSSNSIIKYSCQRNNAFIVTDGFAAPNDVPNDLDYSSSTFFTGNPYQSIPKPSLTDLASGYFNANLRNGRSDLRDGLVEPEASTVPNADLNKNLHMNTYGLTLGASGTLWKKNSSGNFPAQFPSGAMSWPTPDSQSPMAVDDLWHATINGRGKMFTSLDATETAEAVEEALGDVLNKGGTQTGVGVLSVNLSKNDVAYLASFNSAGWWGDFEAYPVNSNTGVVNDTDTARLWSAAEKLDAKTWSNRILVTYKGTAGVVFNSTNVTDTQLTTSPAITGVTTAQIVDYLRGDRTLENTTPAKLRPRAHLFGPIVNAQPAIDPETKVGYVPANDGFVHAIDLETGEELWGYMPGRVLPKVRATARKAWAFSTLLDGTPTIGRVAGSKVLFGGLGTAGTGYYAIDVQDPKSALTATQRAAKIKWEFPNSSTSATVTNNLGISAGRPLFVRINGSNAEAVIVASGYNTPSAGDGKGHVYVLDAASGGFASGFSATTFVTTEGTPSPAATANGEAGLAYLTPFLEADGSVRYVYGGDLLGNVWRFDLVAKTAPTRITTLVDASGNRQPIAGPLGLANFEGTRVVMAGTGRMLGQSDFISRSDISAGTYKTQSLYVMTDTGTTIATPRTSLVKQTLSKVGDNRTIASPQTVNWSTARGWYMDLLEAERANTQPFILGGNVVFVTNVPDKDACGAASYLYRISFLTGDEKFDNLAGAFLGNGFTAKGLGVGLVNGGTRIILNTNSSAGGDGGSGAGACVRVGNVLTCGNTDPGVINAVKNSWRQVLTNE